MKEKKHNQQEEILWQTQLPLGYAYHQVITNDQEEPVDYVFLQVNPAFETMTGKKANEIVGKRVTEVFPGMKTDKFDWIGTFGHVAMTGESCQFQQFSKPLNKWFSISGYSDKKGYFAVVFQDITRHMDEKEKLQKILQASQCFLNMEGDVNYQQLGDDMRRLSGAAFVAFNQFDSNGLDFITEALVSSQDQLQRAIEILGFNPVGRKWPHDPVRQGKTEGRMITTFESLQELAGEVILPDMVQALEKEFGIGQVVIVKIAKQEMVMGDFTLLMPRDVMMLDTDLIALYATQVGLYLDRVQHVKNLKAQRQRLADIIEGTHVGTWEWNIQSGDMVINDRWAQIIGYSLEDLEPVNIDTWTTLVHPDDRVMTQAEIQQVFNHEKDYYDIECRIKHREGHWVWVYDRGKVVVWTEDGQPLVMSGTHTDITEKKRAQEALARSEQEYRAYMDKSPLAIFVSTQEGYYLRANQAACKLTGYTEEELKKLTIMDLAPPEHRNKEKAGVQEIDKHGTVTAEFVGLKKNGDRYWGRLHASRINATETIGFVEDITERKRRKLNWPPNRRSWKHISPPVWICCVFQIQRVNFFA